MTTTAYNLATSTDEYVSILSDIVTLAERGADGSDEVDWIRQLLHYLWFHLQLVFWVNPTKT